MDKRVLDKIRKCLALSKSDNANEAATALRQAEALMKAHGITDADLELSTISQHSATCSTAAKPAQYLVSLAAVIGEAFGVTPVLTSTFTGSRVEFIGPTPQPEIASYAYEVLRKQVVDARTDHIKSQNKRLKRSTKTRRGDLFAMAWVSAVDDMVSQFAQPQSEKVQALVQQYKAKTYGKLSETQGRAARSQRRDQSSALAGLIAGRNAQLHQGMNATQRAQLEKR